MKMVHNLLCYQFHEMNYVVVPAWYIYLLLLILIFNVVLGVTVAIAIIKKKHKLLFGSIERIFFRYKACCPFTGGMGLVTQPAVVGGKGSRHYNDCRPLLMFA
jgi:hypothetical protein